MADMPVSRGKVGSVIKDTADYTDLTDILEPSWGDSPFLHVQATKNVPSMKILLDLGIYPDTTGAANRGDTDDELCTDPRRFSLPYFWALLLPRTRGQRFTIPTAPRRMCRQSMIQTR